MSSTTLQQLKELGESLGLQGPDLIDFIKDQQNAEREERERQRAFIQIEAAEREKERLEEEKKRQDEHTEEQAKREEEEKRRQFETVLQAQRDKDREYELAQRDKEMAQRDKDRAFELAQRDKEREHELEKLKLQMELQEREAKLKQTQETKDPKTTTTASSGSSGISLIKAPKMPYFDEERDFMDSYLERFERFASSQKWEPTNWALCLSALLRGRALDVYSMMPKDDVNNYELLKDALLKRYQLTADGFKKRLRTAKPETGETPTQFLTRIGNYLERWIVLAKADKTYEGLKNLIIEEQYLKTCPKEMAMYLKEGRPKTIKELGEIAENYIEAHATDIVFGIDPKSHKIRSFQSKQRACHNCGGTDHLKNQCPKLLASTPSSPPKTLKASQPPFQKPAYYQKQQYGKPSWQTHQQKAPLRCFNCQKLGHIAKDCRMKQAAAAEFHVEEECSSSDEVQEETAAAFQPMGPAHPVPPSRSRNTIPPVPNARNIVPPVMNAQNFAPARMCRPHNIVECQDCLHPPRTTHYCQALVAVCQECGQHQPVITDACQSKNKAHNMPVSDGLLENQPVKVLRDTGCSTVVVRRSLVPEDKLTGQEECCILIDGTIRRTPVAEVFVDTPYYTGLTTAVCMKNPIYDLIIGNIKGAIDLKSSPQPTQAVQTRSQAKATKGQTPLVTPTIDLGLEDIAKLQEEDENLRRAMDAAKQKTNPQYQLHQKFLYRMKTNRQGQTTKQLALPEKLRQRVMTLAHAGVMSGHQGVHRTQERVAASFWWPGMTSDITLFCQSCDICQRTVSKGRVSKVPLGKMPVIDTPFKRVAVDLVGEIFPASSRGHRYILTVVDYATRYPEAVALKNISTISVAEALVSIFFRVGIPQEILSDQGTQFTSNLMKEVGRLLSMKQLTTTPYHPQCNGLVERFNGTLKTMLKRMCAERPKDWDRYIDALLFAYREAPQESLGFAPFEMLYGRSVNGPLQILRQLWTKEQDNPETRTTYQYVVDLRNRLQETWDMAHDELRRSQIRQKRHFDFRAKERTFKHGDQVLILLPTSDNKLLMQWKGPFEVLERIEGHDYLIQLANKQKVFHANLLKRYFPAIQEEPTSSNNSINQAEINCAAILEPEDDLTDQGPELETLNPLQKETVRDVKISSELSEAQQADVRVLLEEYKDIFTDVPSITDFGEHRIQLTTAEPIKGRAYSLPLALRETLDREIDSMLAMGIIEESAAAYASPVVMVKKPDGSTRVCIDYRKLNTVTVFDPEPMPTAEEIFAKLAGDRYFSKFDLSKGYWQVPVCEQDRDLTTFICHRGLFRFRVMPFGLVNAPATFSRLMRRVLRDSQGLDNYLDDVLAHTSDWNRHLLALRDFFERICHAKLTLRPSKCEIGETTVSFLGHSLSEGVMSPRQETVDKILNAPPPRTLKQLRAFLGLASFYRKYVPNFAVIAAPLTDATKKGNPNEITWNDAREYAFQELKKRISTPPILRLPDVTQPFILQTDASHLGVGAVLLQEDCAGEKRPVAFASRKLQPRESRYSTIERECLAIVWGITKFQEYLYGSEFILETDHQPLQYLRQAKFQNGRLMRWALTLQPYRFLLRAIRGRDNVAADCLSRNPLDDEPPTE